MLPSETYSQKGEGLEHKQKLTTPVKSFYWDVAFFAVLQSTGQSKSYSHANGRTQNIVGLGL